MNLTSIIPWKKEGRSLTPRHENGDPFALFQRRMNSLFDDFLAPSSGNFWNGSGKGFAPQIALSETDKEVRVTAELPGLDEKEVEVTLSENLLNIKGEKKQEHEAEQGDSWYNERSYGYFERTVQLPEGVDADNAKAQFKKGVLGIILPKKPEAQRRCRKIELIES